MKSENEQKIIRIVIATGISSVVTQLLTIREFLAQFEGNEFVIALILFSWLILGGIGTRLAHFVFKRFQWTSFIGLAWLSLWLSGVPVLQILAIRKLRDFFFIHGTSVGFYPTFAYIFLTIAPYCLIIGFVLPYSLFVLRNERPGFSGTRIYIMDNIGDVSGGLLFSFALVFLVTPLQAIAIAAFPLLAASYLLFPKPSRHKISVIFCAGLTAVILVSGILIETASLAPMEGKLVHYKESRFGRIAIHQDQEQYTLFSGGIPSFSSQNLSMAEEAVHYPLAQLKQVERILLISSEGGMMEEVKKYQPDSIDYVELDPEVTKAQFQFGLIKEIPGLNMLHLDGRTFLAETDRVYDAIIVNLPEPDTFQINRFFTDRFFDLARRHLAEHGVLSFSLKGYDNYLAEPQRQKLSSLYNTVGDYFKHVLLLPGQKVFFLCSAHPIRTDIPISLEEKKISTQYIRSFFHGNVTSERIERLNGLMDPLTPKNRDTSPRLMRLMFLQWFAKFSTSPAWFMAVTAVLILVYLFRITKEEYVLFSTGCMTMGSEIVVIFAFQIYFGYIYHQIGLIITVFLAGLLPGAWFGSRLTDRGKMIMMLTDGLLLVFMGLFLYSLHFGGDRLPVGFFLGLGFFVSIVCGCQFPVALQIGGGDNPAASRAFSADLMGAACGTLVTSVLLIPYFGIMWAIMGLAGLKLSSLVIVGMGHE